MIQHKDTDTVLRNLIGRPSGHAYILSCQDVALANDIASAATAEWLGVAAPKLASHPYVRTVEPIKDSIGIEQIRELQDFARLKVPSVRPITRVIHIIQADTMTEPAQNSLLKLLEEPPQGTVFILTTRNAADLESTIRSRTQQLEIKLPTKTQLLEYFTAQDHDLNDIERAFALEQGVPSAMEIVLDKNGTNTKASDMARELLSSGVFERLKKVDVLSKDKVYAAACIQAMIAMSSSALTNQAASADKVARWRTILQACITASNAMSLNANPKLVLSELFVAY